jgi:tRNA A37 methylthiotransferase MiaB
LLSENEKQIEYYSDPYDSCVEIVLLNTCGFISSGREEMFQTVDKLLKKKKKICLIGCGVQYFEKVLKKQKTDNKIIKSELDIRNSVILNENISYLSRNDLTFAKLESLTKSSQNFDDFCLYLAPRLLTNYENRYEYLKIAE